MEKQERKFFREVEKEKQAREERKTSKKSKKTEKENFMKKYFPTRCSLPGGTLKLIQKDVTSSRNRGVETIATCTSRNFSVEKLNFTNVKK